MAQDNTSSESKWENLTPEQYHVCKLGETETPFSGKYLHNKEKGVYECVVCGSPLFSSDAKFDSGTGWPAFDQPMNLAHITLKEDTSYGMIRTEVLCKNCGAHLGHVFPDGPTETGERYCINSVALDFKAK